MPHNNISHPHLFKDHYYSSSNFRDSIHYSHQEESESWVGNFMATHDLSSSRLKLLFHELFEQSGSFCALILLIDVDPKMKKKNETELAVNFKIENIRQS